MAATLDDVAPDVSADPFGERIRTHWAVHKRLLGAHFLFESDCEALMDQVGAAYGGLPPHHLPHSEYDFRVELRLVPGRSLRGAIEPPPVQMRSGAGLLCGVVDACNYVMVMPAQRRALVVVSSDMLGFPYHLRYELIEFAVFVLATRGVGLVPLHGACVGSEGRCVLLLGASGAGKSTLALHSVLKGLDLLSEDAVFVEPETLLATGVANYVHVKADALRFIDDERARHWIGMSPTIRRRSGVEKFEADVRTGFGRVAAAPLAVVGAVFVSGEPADDVDGMLTPVPTNDIAIRLRADQPYAAGQSGWRRFEQKLVAMGMYELRRGLHPSASVDAVRELLQRRSKR
ncbi:serine kinase [Dyella monticola]|uniref:Serine kinase n=1 Tax=Dyella monticola TaxID=1927958 RepID=A0A370X5Z9_9GAMM|nr:serine kinase [Dyella monticola]RDS83700.1 serine kinase [Dyella monticola]